ncbi:hypothetical protein [Jiangella aurantiaca]|uniref:hypothetical protein n=1 Tax=Jiangella aurantiaca TaxID=2530373 RepID=UPI0013A5C0B4|nr:hypothetical protein [Jiangella aurantiaca]
MMANDDLALNGVSGRPLELLARWLSDAGDDGIATRARFDLAGGEWTRRFVLP